MWVKTHRLVLWQGGNKFLKELGSEARDPTNENTAFDEPHGVQARLKLVCKAHLYKLLPHPWKHCYFAPLDIVAPAILTMKNSEFHERSPTAGGEMAFDFLSLSNVGQNAPLIVAAAIAK